MYYLPLFFSACFIRHFSLAIEVNITSFTVTTPVFENDTITVECILESPGDAVIRAQKNAKMAEINQAFNFTDHPKCKSYYPRFYNIVDCTDTLIKLEVKADWEKRGSFVCTSGNLEKTIHVDVYTLPIESECHFRKDGPNTYVLNYDACAYPTPYVELTKDGKTITSTDSGVTVITNGTDCVALRNKTEMIFTVIGNPERVLLYTGPEGFRSQPITCQSQETTISPTVTTATKSLTTKQQIIVQTTRSTKVNQVTTTQAPTKSSEIFFNAKLGMANEVVLGIIVGVMALICAIALIFYCFKRNTVKGYTKGDETNAENKRKTKQPSKIAIHPS